MVATGQKLEDFFSGTTLINHYPLVIQNAEFERIFVIEANGRMVLRGKEIAVDKEVADILISCYRVAPSLVSPD